MFTLTQAMRTVAFQNTVVSLPFFTANTSLFPLESTHFLDLEDKGVREWNENTKF